MSSTRIKGFADMFPPQSDMYTYMESVAREIFGRFGFVELRTPILEFTELFQRSIGQETDVVQKEMYTFADRKGRSLSLRPEATAGVMRAYMESGLSNREAVSRLFTFGPMFRYERPQKGRMRQFHQINCECLGSHSPFVDAEMLCMLWAFLHGVGLKDVELHVNSLGCPNCRPRFTQALQEYLHAFPKEALCEDCARRLASNPLRVLDCKQEGCRQITEKAPRLLDYNCPSCRTHFDKVLHLLEGHGMHPVLNHKLVRGLDYYCRTTFEVVSGNIGAQTAVAGGGRYDGLLRSLGGPDVPGIGFACGMERLSLLMGETPARHKLFCLLAMDEESRQQGWHLTQNLRLAGLAGEMLYAESGFKSLMRQAGKSGARYCLIIGPDESKQGKVVIKNMANGSQECLSQDRALHYLSTGQDTTGKDSNE
ncbi:MAG: histidine--tRNA ligase [Desulfovibrio sp.]|nr:histidine--tRNA ligase [Desulfovibrio sp.]